MKHDQTLPLDLVWEGALVELVGLQSNDKSSQRLAELGLLPNTRIAVLKCTHGQPLIIRVRGSKIAIDRQTAHRILVRPVCRGPRFRHRRRAWRRNWRRHAQEWRHHHGHRALWVTALLDALQALIGETDGEE